MEQEYYYRKCKKCGTINAFAIDPTKWEKTTPESRTHTYQVECHCIQCATKFPRFSDSYGPTGQGYFTTSMQQELELFAAYHQQTLHNPPTPKMFAFITEEQ